MKTAFYGFVCFIFCRWGFAQTPTNDTAFVQQARQQAVGVYEQTLLPQAHIFEGNQYVSHDPRIKEFPFYLTNKPQQGTIRYNGITYRHIQMLYDIVRDELAVKPPGDGYLIRLHPEKVQSFEIDGHQFMRLTTDSLQPLRTGFYQVLYNGGVKALARRIKTIQEDLSGGKYSGDYLVKDKFYILKNGSYYDVKNKAAALKILADRRKELRAFIREHNLRFKGEQLAGDVAKLTQYYDQLTRHL